MLLENNGEAFAIPILTIIKSMIDKTRFMYYLNPTTSRLSLLLHGGRVLITVITYECSGI